MCPPKRCMCPSKRCEKQQTEKKEAMGSTQGTNSICLCRLDRRNDTILAALENHDIAYALQLKGIERKPGYANDATVLIDDPTIDVETVDEHERASWRLQNLVILPEHFQGMEQWLHKNVPWKNRPKLTVVKEIAIRQSTKRRDEQNDDEKSERKRENRENRCNSSKGHSFTTVPIAPSPARSSLNIDLNTSIPCSSVVSPIMLLPYNEALSMVSPPIEDGDKCYVCNREAVCFKLHAAWCKHCITAIFMRNSFKVAGLYPKRMTPRHALEHAFRWHCLL